MPVTIPVGSTVPRAGLLLLHVPPGDASVNVMVWPTHTAGGPRIGAGNGLTVTVNDAVQEVGSV